MAIQIRINAAVFAALVVCEVISYVWYSEAMPWRRYEDRYLIPALCADFGLSVLIQWMICTHWGVRGVQDALALGLGAACFYASLVAPHAVVGPSSGVALALSAAHKFVIVSAMTLTQFYVRKAGY